MGVEFELLDAPERESVLKKAIAPIRNDYDFITHAYDLIPAIHIVELDMGFVGGILQRGAEFHDIVLLEVSPHMPPC